MTHRSDNPTDLLLSPEEQQQIRDAAQRESYQYNDPRANYQMAEDHRRQRAEGAALQAAA